MSKETTDKRTRLSMKHITVHHLRILIDQFKEMGEGNDYQVLLLTPYGFLKGDLEEISEKKDFIKTTPDNPNSFQVDLSHTIKIRNDYLEELSTKDSIEFTDNGFVLNFRNVEVYKDTMEYPVITMGQMLVFSDQIISCSLIPREID